MSETIKPFSEGGRLKKYGFREALVAKPFCYSPVNYMTQPEILRDVTGQESQEKVRKKRKVGQESEEKSGLKKMAPKSVKIPILT